MVAGVAHELNTPIGNCLVVATACAAKQREFEAEIEHGLKRSSLNALVEGNRKAMDLLQVNLRRSAELISSFASGGRSDNGAATPVFPPRYGS
ncbi:MAG: hypothetical protein IPN98_05010 [Propionivibrio sp.]|nr:hypothetical protein [Propionivibrio sp.]